MDPIDDNISFFFNSEPYLFDWGSVRIIKGETTITVACPRATGVSRIRDLYIADSLTTLAV